MKEVLLTLRDDDSDPCGKSPVTNIGFRVGAMFVVFVTSLVGTLFPVITRRVPRLRAIVPGPAFDFAKYFGSGVILSTAIVHLLEPAADGEIGPANTVSKGGCVSDAWADYPYAFGICLASLFFTFLLELVAFRFGLAFVGRGLASIYPSPGVSLRPDMTPVNQNFRAGQDVQTSIENSKVLDLDQPQAVSSLPADDEHYHDTSEAIPPSAQIIAVAILEFGILFHSVIIGMTIALSAPNQFNTLFIVIIFHQAFEGLGLGTRLSFLQLPPSWQWAPVAGSFAYSIATPLGMSIGLGARASISMTSTNAAIASGILDSISAGILLYSGTVQLIAAEFILSPYYHTCSWKKLIFVLTSFLAGGSIMSLLAKWI